MGVGGFVHEFEQFIREVTLKTTTGCTKGDLGHYDTDGFHQATTGDKRPFVVFTKTVVAPESGQSKATAAAKGCITVGKAAGPINEHQYVKPAANGKVTAFVVGSDSWDDCAGKGLKAATSGATTVDIILGE